MLLRHCLQNVFLLLLVHTHLVRECYQNCHVASLRAMNPKLSNDCDLVNDKLFLSFPSMTTKPHCISQITNVSSLTIS